MADTVKSGEWYWVRLDDWNGLARRCRCHVVGEFGAVFWCGLRLRRGGFRFVEKQEIVAQAPTPRVRQWVRALLSRLGLR